MKKKLFKFLSLVFVIITATFSSITSYASEIENNTNTYSVSPASIGPGIDSGLTTRPASASNISISLNIPQDMPNGVYFRAAITGNAGTSYTVVVDYPDGETHATLGTCHPNNVEYLTISDTSYIEAGTYTFRFMALDQPTNNMVGFVALIFQNL